MTSPDLQASVVIPTRDRPDRLRNCLAALDRQTAESFEVLVVDDGSVDAAAVTAAVGDRPTTLLVRAGGFGPAAARNLGARHARGPVLCFTDDDCRPGPEWVQTMIEQVADGAAAVAGPTRNGRPDDVFASASQVVTNHLAEASRDGPLPFAPTSNLAVRSDVFAAVSFDETFPLAAGEDREWCNRLAGAGHALEFAPAAWVSHHQELSWRSFWRQQVRYGRGAQHLRRSEHGEGMQRAGFYVDLVRKGFALGAVPGMLVLVAQLATATGLVRGAVEDRRR